LRQRIGQGSQVVFYGNVVVKNPMGGFEGFVWGGFLM